MALWAGSMIIRSVGSRAGDFLIYHIVRLYFADTVNNSQGAEYDRDDPGSGLRDGEKQAKQGENAAENDNEYKNAVPGAVDLRSRNCVHIPVRI